MIFKFTKMSFFVFIIWAMNACSSSSNLVKETESDFSISKVDTMLIEMQVDSHSLQTEEVTTATQITHPLEGVEKENCFLPSRSNGKTYNSLLTPIKDVFGRSKTDYYSTSTKIEKLLESAEVKNRTQLDHSQAKTKTKSEKSLKTKNKGNAKKSSKINVLATAYNSVPAQTDSTPNKAAWGDRLKPGMKSIAVSRDLLKMGFTRGVKVKIEGLPGTYVVLDKMNKRWRKKIDIYMGKDVRKARKWGKRRVTIIQQ